MTLSVPRDKVVRFGVFELDLHTSELRKQGIKLRLQGQPLRVLARLLETPGELVTREELRKRVWGGETFVDFDQGLNNSIQRIREVLGDSAQSPHFIETVPRRGYRFVGVPSVSPEAPASTPSQTEQKRTRRRGYGLAIALAVLLVCIGTIVSIRLQHRRPDLPPIKAIAVLPLENVSGDPSQEFFADGITDELTTTLAKLGNLRVIPRSSARVHADSHKPLAQIAKDLNVDAVLTGAVERSGNRVRLRVSLVRGGTNDVLWAESYDRDLGDIAALEGEVSQAIADEVGIKLTPQAQHGLEHGSTRNPEAHDAYLRARYFLDKDDKEGATKCLQYFQEAVAKDPGYAAAYSGLSRCYALAYYFDMLPFPEAIAKQRSATLKAVALDEELGEAHSELADYYFENAWKFGDAEREYQRALELDPNSASVHEDYSFFLQRIGRAEEAVREMKRARELDPLSLHEADSVGWTLLYTRRYDEAVDQFHKVLEMDPTYRRSIWGLARVYEVMGKYKEAIAECLKIPALPRIDPFAKDMFRQRCSLYQNVYVTTGREHINRRWFESSRQQINDYIKTSDDLYFVATLYATSGADDKALDLLEQLYTRRDNDLVQLKVDPRMDKLRSNPRFQALLRRMNFPD